MNSKNFVLVAVLSLSIFAPVVVRAETSTTPTVSPKLRQEMRENRKEVRQEVREINKEVKTTVVEKRKELKATSAQTRQEFQKTRMTINQNGLYKSFTVRVASLAKYQSMIQARLDAKTVKLGATNQNLVDAKTKLATIAGLTTTYSADLAKYKATIDSLSTAADPKSLFTTLRTQAKVVETDIKNIRKSLVEALRLVVKAK